MKLPLTRYTAPEYGVSTSIGYGVSNLLYNTAYSIQLINMAYPLPLDTAYRSSGTEAEPNGLDHEDANEHIEKVLEIVDLFHIPNITIDQVMLRAFPMSLTGAASRWLRNKPTGSITTWEDLKTKFLRKYCPPARTTKKIEEINNFQQELDENLYQA
ncbi:hypothetical protein Tco_0327900 [Tanacetum coccineum]